MNRAGPGANTQPGPAEQLQARAGFPGSHVGSTVPSPRILLSSEAPPVPELQSTSGLPEMWQPTQKPGSEMASADSPASALLAEAPGTEGSVRRLWGNLKMVPK